MKRIVSALVLVMLTMLALFAFLLQPQSTATPSQLLSHAEAQAPVGSGEPCVQGDPFQLEQLRTVLSSDQPPDDIQINRFLTVKTLGVGKLISETVEIPPFEPSSTPGDTEPNEPDRLEVNTTQFIVFNTRTQYEFELTLDGDMLNQIRECYTENRLDQGNTDVFEDPTTFDEPKELFLPSMLSSDGNPTHNSGSRARSNGIDNRIIRQPTTNWPWRTIAQFGEGCSGTMIGPRHLITAAHCINERGTSNWYTVTVRPGRDTAADDPTPYGQSTISLDPPPGVEAWYFTHPQWRNPNTAGGQWDWGMIVIPDRLGDQSGWMGYAAFVGSYLKQHNQYNRGYPACWVNRPDTPADCQQGRLYGDLNTCKLGAFNNPGPDNWNRTINHTCDTSGGHSGSPMYQYYYDGALNRYVPVVVGVHYGSRCDKNFDSDEICNLFDFYPSVIRRNTPTEFAIISYFREVFP